MTWTAEDQRAVGRALLGSWPGTVAAWGADAIAAYIAELEARGLTADGVLFAIRTWPSGSDFPPSASNLGAGARRDPSVPTFDELVSLVYGRAGILKARLPYIGPIRDPERVRHDTAIARAREMHPLVYAFVAAPRRLEWLRLLEIDDPDDGHFRRKELADAWARHLEASEGRDLAALASRRGPGELRRLDPLAAVMGAAPGDRRELGRGDRSC